MKQLAFPNDNNNFDVEQVVEFAFSRVLLRCVHEVTKQTMQKRWTKTELILTMNLYCKLPFGKFHKGTFEVIELAKMIDRTPSAVAMKLSNLASLDPFHAERV